MATKFETRTAAEAAARNIEASGRGFVIDHVKGFYRGSDYVPGHFLVYAKMAGCENRACLI